MKTFLILISLFTETPGTIAAKPRLEWRREIDYGGKEKIHGIDIANNGSLFFTGESDTGQCSLELWKFSNKGDSLWRSTYYANKGDIGYNLLVLPDNNIAVVGIEYSGNNNPQSVSLRFKTNGKLIKAMLTPAYSKDTPPAIAARHEDSCYIGTFGSNTASSNLETKYYLLDKNWGINKFYNTSAHMPITGMTIGSSGSLYQAKSPCRWGKMSYDLKGLGVVDYKGNPDEKFNAQGLAISKIDELYCCGDVYNISEEEDFFLLKWDTLGNPIWGQGKHKRYNLGAREYCLDISLDSITDCYLGGYQVTPTDENTALVKTDSAGNMLWSWVDTINGKQRIEAIDLDKQGYIYLAGAHHNGTDWDMLLMKIAQPLTITGRVTDSTNSPMKNISVEITGDSTVEVTTDTAGFYSITVYNGKNYTLSPKLAGWSFEPPSYTYTPLSHREFKQNFTNGRWTAISEDISPLPSNFDIQITNNQIVYSIPYSIHVKLNLYNLSGCLVTKLLDKDLQAGSHTLALKIQNNPNYPSGIYFVRFITKDYTATEKILLLK